ncbi:hypothetical protein [Nocardioides sp. AX2bis]|uniref:hypothetical protein n=1 Tax=Nocardioides sp. AX2bis TaxID=2653157 RepID=UPI0012F1268D|nr:hypothetical protein [Nocardioides sp. AX2bis]VXC08793.1 hypothetical protein NOCARDAX2BIS_420005 [Nocardioides sp. AX2bis]
MDDDLPDLTTPTDLSGDLDDVGAYRPTVNTQADLERLWRVLMRPLGFAETSLWAMLLDADGRPLPVLTEITDLAHLPDPGETRSMAAFLGDLVDEHVPGGRVALLRTRPGRGRARPDDLAWAAALHTALAAAGVPADVVHLATDDQVLPLPLDALPVSA